MSHPDPPHTSELGEPPGPLREDRDASDAFELSPDALSAMLDEINAQRPTGWRAALAERSRGWRALVLSGALLALGAILLLASGVRGDLAQARLPLYLSALGLTCVSAGALLILALDGVEDPPRGQLSLGAALLAPGALVLAFTSTMDGALPATVETYTTGNCFAFAGGYGLVFSLIARLFQRDVGWSWRRMVLAGATGTSVALLALDLHCPSRDATHLTMGHVGGYVTVLAVMWLGALFLDRARAN